jgi:hypothetical protein
MILQIAVFAGGCVSTHFKGDVRLGGRVLSVCGRAGYDHRESAPEPKCPGPAAVEKE